MIYYVNSSYLSHHGIPGQKWGVRNGPPYPLSRQSGRKKQPTVAEGTYKLKKYTSPARQLAKSVAVSVPVGLLSAIIPGFNVAVYALSIKQSYDYSSFGTDWAKKEGEAEKLSSLKKKEAPSDIESDLKVVNTRKNKKGGVNNCVNCTVAMEMRSRGYDVVARSTNTGFISSEYKNWFKDAKINAPTFEREKNESRKQYANRTYNELCNSIEKEGNGAHGAMLVRWDKLPGDKSAGGHSIFWEVIDNEVKFFDGQNGSVDNDKVFALADPNGYQWIRLDNLELKDEITTMVRSRK